jgi:alpha-amylase
VSSIHERVVFKQEGLDQRLRYDPYPRKSMLDHFYPTDATLPLVRDGNADELGDFLGSPYETRIRRNPDRIQIQLLRQGSVQGMPVKITKGVTAQSGSSTLEIAYLLEGLPAKQPLHFGVEFNFAGLPSRANDRFFFQGDDRPLGELQTELDLHETGELCLTDRWLGLDIRIAASQPTAWWTFPIETVSNSEGGFELVHQSVVVVPHWIVLGDATGRWSATIQLELDTSLAESRGMTAIGAEASLVS